VSKHAQDLESIAAHPEETYIFDVELRTGRMSVEAGPEETLSIVNWLHNMRWMSREDRDSMFSWVREEEA
jgi:hypothetical protein